MFAVLLQEMPSYNERRRSQTALVERQPSLLQRCRSNPQIYYGRAKTLSGINGSSTLLSSISCPHRRDAGLRGLYSALTAYRPPSSDAGVRHYDTDSLQSLSVSSASSLSGAFCHTVSRDMRMLLTILDSSTEQSNIEAKSHHVLQPQCLNHA